MAMMGYSAFSKAGASPLDICLVGGGGLTPSAEMHLVYSIALAMV